MSTLEAESLPCLFIWPPPPDKNIKRGTTGCAYWPPVWCCRTHGTSLWKFFDEADPPSASDCAREREKQRAAREAEARRAARARLPWVRAYRRAKRYGERLWRALRDVDEGEDW